MTWPAVSGATTYTLYRSAVGASGPWTEIADSIPAATPTAIDTGSLAYATQYWYQVTANNASGTSAPSPAATATTPPAAPAPVTAQPGDTTATVGWTPPSGATGYKTYRGATSGGETQLVQTTTNDADDPISPLATTPSPLP